MSLNLTLPTDVLDIIMNKKDKDKRLLAFSALLLKNARNGSEYCIKLHCYVIL